MILAGDVGATKTVLALYRREDPIRQPYRQQRYASRDFPGLEPIVADFLAGAAGGIPSTAAFGIAGPVVGRSVETTNLPWKVDAWQLEQRFGIRSVALLNDLQATATAVPFLEAADFRTLHPATADPRGLVAVIAPGTGLGMALLVTTEHGHLALPTEGGHMSFAPGDDMEIDLLRFLRNRFGHVSYERIASGSGLPNVYEFFRAEGQLDEPAWLREQLGAAGDPTPVIVAAALEQQVPIAVATLDGFVRVLGSAIGSAALLSMPTGGIYLGGGIPPRILQRLRQPDFLEAVHAKGRSRALLERMPLHVILDAESALHGAVWHARQIESSLSTTGICGPVVH